MLSTQLKNNLDEDVVFVYKASDGKEIKYTRKELEEEVTSREANAEATMVYLNLLITLTEDYIKNNGLEDKYEFGKRIAAKKVAPYITLMTIKEAIDLDLSKQDFSSLAPKMEKYRADIKDKLPSRVILIPFSEQEPAEQCSKEINTAQKSNRLKIAKNFPHCIDAKLNHYQAARNYGQSFGTEFAKLKLKDKEAKALATSRGYVVLYIDEAVCGLDNEMSFARESLLIDTLEQKISEFADKKMAEGAFFIYEPGDDKSASKNLTEEQKVSLRRKMQGFKDFLRMLLTNGRE